MENQSYVFEILAIDKNGQTNITGSKNLLHAMIFSESLWKTPDIIENHETYRIEDKEQSLSLKLHAIDTSQVLNDVIESAFLIKITGTDFDQIENFRIRFLLHLKNKLGFNNIRILTDDISATICNELSPMINQVENLLRRYLVKFFIQKIGTDWWELTAPKSMIEKVKIRKNNEKTFSSMVDIDVTLIDFNDLGELIFKQTTGFNKPEIIIQKIMETITLNQLQDLKDEMQGNYTKYFKEAFRDNQFESKWKMLAEIRNKVSHNWLFVNEDREITTQLCDSLVTIINDAESKIQEFSFSIDEKMAIRNITIEAISDQETEVKEKTLEKLGIKVVGKIDLPDEPADEYFDDQMNSYKIISEEDLMKELEIAEGSLVKHNMKYVGLKAFVTKILGNKGYAYGPTYSLVNILRDQGVVEIYDVEDENSFYTVKAIKKA
jgi:uncharacterized protein with HEPN domain